MASILTNGITSKTNLPGNLVQAQPLRSKYMNALIQLPLAVKTCLRLLQAKRSGRDCRVQEVQEVEWAVLRTVREAAARYSRYRKYRIVIPHPRRGLRLEHKRGHEQGTLQRLLPSSCTSATCPQPGRLVVPLGSPLHVISPLSRLTTSTCG